MVDSRTSLENPRRRGRGWDFSTQNCWGLQAGQECAGGVPPRPPQCPRNHGGEELTGFPCMRFGGTKKEGNAPRRAPRAGEGRIEDPEARGELVWPHGAVPQEGRRPVREPVGPGPSVDLCSRNNTMGS